MSAAVYDFNNYLDDKMRSLFEIFKPSKTPAKTSDSVKNRIPAPPPGVVKNTVWVNMSDSAEIATFKISGAGFYHGTSLKTSGILDEPSLINPLLRVSETDDGVTVNYVEPSYAKFTPSQRYKYLKWLSTGCVEKTSPSFVYLYFYGLERRALLEGLTRRQLLPELHAEIKRIADRHPCIHSHAVQLLKFLEMHMDDLKNNDFITSDTRYIIGRLLSVGKEINLDLLADFVSQSCSVLAGGKTEHIQKIKNWELVDEHKENFKQWLKHVYKKGMPFTKSYSYYTVEYKACSPVLKKIPFILTTKASDFVASRKNINMLVDAIQAWVSDVSKYLNFIKKKPEYAGTLEAELLLPAQLRSSALHYNITNLQKEVAGYDVVELPLSNLLSLFNTSEDISPSKYQAIVTMLQDANMRVIPDSIKSDTPENMTLWITDNSGIMNDVYLEGLKYAISKDILDRSLIDINMLSNFMDCSNAKLLYSHLKHILANGKKFSIAKAKLVAASDNEKEMIIKIITSSLHTNDTPALIAKLETLCKYMGLDVSRIYSMLHGTKINSSNELDLSKIKLLQAETHSIALVLNDVFKEESPAPAPPKKDVIDTTCRVPILKGFTTEETNFIQQLSRSSYTTEDFKELASKLDVMLSGIVESINDKTMDMYDDILIEESDKFVINSDILKAIVETTSN